MLIEKTRIIQLVDDLVLAIFNIEKEKDKSNWPAQLAFESGLVAMGREVKIRLMEILEDMEKIENQKNDKLIDIIEEKEKANEKTSIEKK